MAIDTVGTILSCVLFQALKQWEESACPKVVVKAPNESSL